MMENSFNFRFIKSKIKTIFHHLTKEELIEKVLANHLNHLEQTNKGKQNK